MQYLSFAFVICLTFSSYFAFKIAGRGSYIWPMRLLGYALSIIAAAALLSDVVDIYFGVILGKTYSLYSGVTDHYMVYRDVVNSVLLTAWIAGHIMIAFSFYKLGVDVKQVSRSHSSSVK